MKKTIYILLTFALVMTGCDKVTEKSVENSAVQFEVTSSHVIFNADGGSKTVLVTSNLNWNCSTDATWFGLSAGDGYIEIAADANNDDAPRYGEVLVVASKGDENYVETISIAQRVSDDNAIDLSDGETANCYIANTGANYRFNALVKGNGVNTEGGAKAYIEKYGVTINPEEIVYADLLWEAVFDADLTRSCNIIDQTPVYDGGYVYFTTGSAEGNAVIAVKDSFGNILWSWHIWVTDADIQEQTGNGYKWMDRNLGALTAEPMDVNNRGLLYQWGRKDPFLPSCSEYAPLLNEENTTVGDGSGEWNYDSCLTKLETEAPGNIPYSIKNPMKVLLANGGDFAWYITMANEDNWNSFLWGDSSDLTTYVKSMFDPCPPGYNVPVANAWTSDTDNNWTSGEGNYGRHWIDCDNAFYPLSGSINGSSGGLQNTSYYGYYWSSVRDSASSCHARYMYFSGSGSIYYTFSYPVHAYSVRCMRAN